MSAAMVLDLVNESFERGRKSGLQEAASICLEVTAANRKSAEQTPETKARAELASVLAARLTEEADSVLLERAS